MENTKPTKLGLLMIGLCSFGFSHEYAGPIVTEQKSLFPSTYQNYHQNKFVGKSDYNDRIVTLPAYAGKRFQDDDDFFNKYERIDPRRIIPFDQLREYDSDTYRLFTQRPAKIRLNDDDDDFDYFAPQQILKYLNDEPRYEERIKYICKNKNRFERRPHKLWKQFDKKRSHLIQVTPGQKVLPLFKEDTRYKNLYKDFGYQIYNGFDHKHDHDHDHDHDINFHDKDKDDYKFVNKFDKDDLKFYNRIDKDDFNNGRNHDKDDLKFINRGDKDLKFYNRIDKDDYSNGKNHDKDDLKFFNRGDKDDRKFYNRIDKDNYSNGKNHDKDDLKFFNKGDKDDRKFYNRIDKDDYTQRKDHDKDDYLKRIVIPNNLREDRFQIGSSLGY